MKYAYLYIEYAWRLPLLPKPTLYYKKTLGKTCHVFSNTLF